MLVYLNGFEINSQTNRMYLDGEVTGLSMPSIRTSSGVYSGLDGGYVGAQYFGVRQISMQGQAFGEDITDLEIKRRSFQQVLINKVVTLRIITNAGNDYIIDCNLLQFDMPIQRTVNIAPFKIELLAPDPIIYDNATGNALTTTLSRIVGGGYTFPMTFPVIWAAGSSPTTIQNNGTATVKPTVTIAGSATNPMISNTTTGQFIKFNNLTMSSGDTLIIDMKARSALLNGGSVFYKLTDDSDWIDLIVGSNVLQYTTDSGSDTAQAVVSFRPGYIGI